MGDPCRWNNARDLEWMALRPELVVEVTFDHACNDRIRHGTTLKRWRDDKAPTDCKMEQLAELAQHHIEEADDAVLVFLALSANAADIAGAGSPTLDSHRRRGRRPGSAQSPALAAAGVHQQQPARATFAARSPSSAAALRYRRRPWPRSRWPGRAREPLFSARRVKRLAPAAMPAPSRRRP